MEGYGRFESLLEGAGKLDHNNTSTRHGIIKSRSGTTDGEKVQLIYLQSTVQHPTHRASQIHVEQKEHGGVSETPRG
jgi:hypothetical protein